MSGIEVQPVRLFGRYVCALPVGVSRRVRQGAAQRMLGINWRRDAVRGVLEMVAAAPAWRRAELTTLPTLGDADEILALASRCLPPWHAVAVYWPPQSERGRAYLHFLGERGGAKAFLKLASGDDAVGLEREREALEALGGGGRHLTTPPLLATGKTGRTRWILTGSLPPIGWQRPKPRKTIPHHVVEEIRGVSRVVDASELATLSWWADLQERLDGAPYVFVQDLQDATRQGVEVGRSHGDFCRHNLARALGRTWVFDWEEYAPDAPIDQDVVNFRLVRGDDLAEVRGAPGEAAYRRFVMCCGFGLARDIPRFRAIVDGWPDLRPEVE